MKTLYLIRHAKSDWSDPALDDFDRPLNRRGEKNAPLMGSILAKEGVHPDLILSSPALRTRLTAQILSEKTGYRPDGIVYLPQLYLADPDTILESIRGIDESVSTLFLIAHNPGITEFAEWISGRAIDNIPTCGIFTVVFDGIEWQGIDEKSGRFVSFDYPKRHLIHD